MGYIKGDALGGRLRGKMGNYVLYERLGRLCIRRRPEDFVPMGKGQAEQRERMRSVNIFYKAVRAAGLAEHWKRGRKPPGWSGFNAFVAANLPAFSGQGYLEGDKAVLAPEAGLQLPDNLRLRGDGGGGWVLEWENATGYPGQSDTDRLVAALMQGGKHFDVRLLAPDGIAAGEGGVPPAGGMGGLQAFVLFHEVGGRGARFGEPLPGAAGRGCLFLRDTLRGSTGCLALYIFFINLKFKVYERKM